MQAGLIINIGSIAGEMAFAPMLLYSTTKWGLRGWSLGCYEVASQLLAYLHACLHTCRVTTFCGMFAASAVDAALTWHLPGYSAIRAQRHCHPSSQCPLCFVGNSLVLHSSCGWLLKLNANVYFLL